MNNFIVQNFPLYVPRSAGSIDMLANLTVKAIQQTLPFMTELCEELSGHRVKIRDVREFCNLADFEYAEKLKVLMNFHGSDKSSKHNYHLLYGPILRTQDDIQNILEVGMGTNNTDVASNMGINGKPGASLRAFRDFCPQANIYGADIDKRILFADKNISTYFVDQTEPITVARLFEEIKGDFNLIIDDGLHSPNANLAIMRFALPRLKKHGWFVVEDIANDAVCVWKMMNLILPNEYHSLLIQTEKSVVFAVQKLK
jgi:hypothetical protein